MYLCNIGKCSSFFFLIPRQEELPSVYCYFFCIFPTFPFFRICIPSSIFISVPLFCSLTSYFFDLGCVAGWSIIRKHYKNFEKKFCICLCKLSWLWKSLRKRHLAGVLPSKGKYRPSRGSRELKKAKMCLKEIRDVANLKVLVMKISLPYQISLVPPLLSDDLLMSLDCCCCFLIFSFPLKSVWQYLRTPWKPIFTLDKRCTLSI